MKKINFPMLLLAMLVIFMFLAAGVSISFQNIGYVLLFIVLGFLTMGFGLMMKRKRSGSQ